MMMKRVAMLGFILLGSGCQPDPVRMQIALPANDMVSVVLKKMKSEGGHTLVYGTLSIENKYNPIKIVNLDCMALQYVDQQSRETDVDTIHSVNDMGLAAKDGKIFIDAVWSFEKPINGSLKDIKLVYSQKNVTTYYCITHEH